jgi:hypothetical protein
LNIPNLVLLFVGIGLLLWLLLRQVAIRRRATLVDPRSPEWRAAVLKAQQTIATAKRLHEAEPGSVIVKFPISTKAGTREHAWGELIAVDDKFFTASLESQMVEAEPAALGPYTLLHNELEDWAKFLPDGSVRGAFTVQAEIRLARMAGQQPSAQAQSMEGRFVDT